MPGTSNRRTRGEVKRAEKRKAEKQRKKREAKRFAPTKVIGRNDILVDRKSGKVKVEMPEEKVVVKQEQEDVVVIVKEEVDLNLVDDTGSGGEREIGTGNILEEAAVSEETTHESASAPVFQGKQEIDSDSGSMEQDDDDEAGTADMPICLNKKCDDLRKENLLLKQQLEENRLRMETVEKQNQQLLEWKKVSFVKLRDICPPATEENNPSVVAGKVLPVLCARGYLVLENLLKCRLVCKNWQEEVDTFLENSPSRQLDTRKPTLKGLSDFSKRETDKLEKKYTFYWPNTPERFLDAFDTCERNPFLGRIAVFGNCGQMDVAAKYWKFVCKCLKKFGKNLYYVTIWRREVIRLALYTLLERVLPHLKNVKCLTISGEFRNWRESNLPEYTTKHLLPLLPNLRFLDFRFPSVLILDAILKISPSLTILKLAFGGRQKENLESVGNTGSPSYISPSLERLEFDFTQTQLYWVEAYKLNELILKRFPKLRELRLKGTISLDEQKLAGFNLVQNMSVEVLQLQLCCSVEAENEKNGILKCLQPDGFYTKVISRFPKLRILTIEYGKNDMPGDYPKHLRDLDVWKRFECLEAITLKRACQRGHVYKGYLKTAKQIMRVQGTVSQYVDHRYTPSNKN